MTRTIHIHIGMHKTGSTSIQKSFDGFHSDNAAYVAFGNSNHSAIHATLFKGKPENYYGHRRNGRSAEKVMKLRATYFDRLNSAIVQNGSRDLITSGEDILTLDPDDLVAMRDYFRAHFSRLHIIGYVRAPASFMASSLQQRIVGGVQSDFDTLYPNYRQAFEKFDDVFGRENVTLTKFDRAQLSNGNVVLDFAERIGVEFDPALVVDANVGLSLESSAIMFAHRRFGKKLLSRPRDLVDNARVADAVRTIGTTKIQLHRDFVQGLTESKRDDIEWMESRLGQSLAEAFSADPKAIKANDELLKIAGMQLGEIGKILAGALSAAKSDPVLLAASVDFLYEIYARERAQRKATVKPPQGELQDEPGATAAS